MVMKVNAQPNPQIMILVGPEGGFTDEEVALALGCSRLQAFSHVVLPEAKRGMLTAMTLAWARSLGEFGPLLIFAGATRNKTEVLSTTVFLELSIGDLEAAGDKYHTIKADLFCH